MAKVKVTVSEFQPVKAKLVIYDENNEIVSDDLWVTLIPPTFREDRARGDVLRTAYSSNGSVSLTNPRLLQAEEIWLTFGGTNLEVELPRLDDDGQIIWKKNADDELEPELETISFPENGKEGMTKETFMNALDRLPEYIVRAWHRLVITKVAGGWAFPF
jgi:hypothetical protein